jgi:hypothetical protein
MDGIIPVRGLWIVGSFTFWNGHVWVFRPPFVWRRTLKVFEWGVVVTKVLWLRPYWIYRQGADYRQGVGGKGEWAFEWVPCGRH